MLHGSDASGAVLYSIYLSLSCHEHSTRKGLPLRTVCPMSTGEVMDAHPIGHFINGHITPGTEARAARKMCLTRHRRRHWPRGAGRCSPKGCGGGCTAYPPGLTYAATAPLRG